MDNHPSLSSGIERAVDNLAVAMHSDPLSHTAAKVGIIAFGIFLMDTKARYAQCGHRTGNLPITIWRSLRLSYAAAIFDAKKSKCKYLNKKKYESFHVEIHILQVTSYSCICITEKKI